MSRAFARCGAQYLIDELRHKSFCRGILVSNYPKLIDVRSLSGVLPKAEHVSEGDKVSQAPPHQKIPPDSVAAFGLRY
jgi:hypothetical protein